MYVVCMYVCMYVCNVPVLYSMYCMMYDNYDYENIVHVYVENIDTLLYCHFTELVSCTVLIETVRILHAVYCNNLSTGTVYCVKTYVFFFHICIIFY